MPYAEPMAEMPAPSQGQHAADLTIDAILQVMLLTGLLRTWMSQGCSPGHP